MFRRQTVIALGVAVVLGLIAVYLANVFLTGAERRNELEGTTMIAVASIPLGYGTELTKEKIRFVEYPNRSIPPGVFTAQEQLLPAGKKRYALMPISINEPILATKISAEGEGASISALLPDGMRAATVRINDVSGVAGFVQPNDRVDVLITRTTGDGDRTLQVTDVLLQNIRVIAMGTNAKGADGKPIAAKTATLEVNPLDAQKLALGEAAGSLSLVLRKPGEENNPIVETVSLNDLRYNMYGGARYPAPAVVGAYQTPPPRASVARAPAPRRTVSRPAPRPSGTSVEIVRGTEGNSYTVGGR
jgi:pilus assembly protein CpaB